MSTDTVITADFKRKSWSPTPPPPTESSDARRASFDVPARPFDNDRLAADVVAAMERFPWREPVIAARRGSDGAVRVLVSVGDVALSLDPAGARLAARMLFADQAFAGCGEVAARLRDAADWADRGVTRTARRPVRTAELTMLGFLLMGGVFALIAAGGVLAGLYGHGVPGAGV